MRRPNLIRGRSLGGARIGHRDDRNIVGIIKKERTIMPLPSTPHEDRAAKGEEAKERAAARKAALKKDADDGITGKA